MVTIDPVVAEACCVQGMAVGDPGCACWIRMLAQAALVCVTSERLDWRFCSVKAGVGAVVFWRGH